MDTSRMNIRSCASFERFRFSAAMALLLGTMWTMMPATPWADSTEQPSQSGPVHDSTWQWVPTQEEIRNYRNSWNPLSNGPILLTAVDTDPKGQFHSQYFAFGEVGHQTFDNKLTTHLSDSSFDLTAVE